MNQSTSSIANAAPGEEASRSLPLWLGAGALLCLAAAQPAQALYVCDPNGGSGAIGFFSAACGSSNTAGTTGAVAFGAFNSANGVNSSAFGQSNLAYNGQSSAFGYNNITSGSSTTAIGANNSVGDISASVSNNSSHSTAVGVGNFAYGGLDNTNGVTAIGDHNSIYGSGMTAIGSRNNASSLFTADFFRNGVMIGVANRVNGSSAIAIGDSAWAGREGGAGLTGGDNAIAMGTTARATGTNSIALGAGAQASAINAMAMGANAVAGHANSVALGANSVTADVNTGAYTINGGVVAGAPSSANGSLSIGQAGQERQIQNVAAGVVSGTSTNAVNGSQLFYVGAAVNASASGAAAGLGGGAAWNAATGAWTAPAYNVNGVTFNNVGAAMTVVNASTNALGSSTASALGGGAVYTPGGGVSAPRYNVQGGTYHDVGSALGAVDSSISGLNRSVAGLGQNITALRRESRQGVALAAAMANVGMPSGAGRTAWRVNTGGYMGYGAISMGIAHRLPTSVPLAITGGVSVGFQSSAMFSIGLQGEF